MSSNPGLEVLIKSILDSKGFADLQQNLQKSKALMDETKSSAGDFKDKMGELGTQFAQTVGAVVAGAEAFSFFKSALIDAIAGEQAMLRFAAANAAVGQTSAEAVAKNSAWLESMEHTAGIGKNELIPMYQKLISSSGDVGAAQAAMQMALGMAARGMGDAEGNVQSLTKYMETGRVRGVGPLATEIRHLTNEGKSQAEILTILGTKYGDAGAAINTNALQVKRAQEDWRQFKENVGSFGLMLVQYLRPALEFAATGITAVVVGAQKLGGYIGVLAGNFKGLFGIVSTFMTGGLSAGIAAFKAWKVNIVGDFGEVDNKATDTAEKIMSAFSRTSSGLIQGAKAVGTELSKWHVKNISELKAIEDEYKTRLAVAESTGIGEMAIMLAKAAVYKEMANDQRLTTLQRAEAEKEYQKLLTQTTEFMLKDSIERRKIAQKLAQDQLKFEAETLEKGRKLHDKDLEQRLKVGKINLKARYQNELEYKNAVAALYDELAGKFMVDEDKKTEYHAAATELRVEVAKSEGDMQVQIANGVLGVLGDAFGASKELSIAQAIINTYEGATKALAQGGIYGAVLAAIVIAAGLVQVANIESQEAPATGSISGKGFDDPGNDFASYVGGQRWARDMVDHFSAGAMAGFNSQVTTNDNHQVFNNQKHEQKNIANYNIRSVGLLDSASNPQMRKFVRTLQVIGTQEAARTPR